MSDATVLAATVAIALKYWESYIIKMRVHKLHPAIYLVSFLLMRVTLEVSSKIAMVSPFLNSTSQLAITAYSPVGSGRSLNIVAHRSICRSGLICDSHQRGRHGGRRRSTHTVGQRRCRRSSAVRTDRPRLTRRSNISLLLFCPNKHWNDGTSIETKRMVAQYAQDGRDLTGVTSDGNKQSLLTKLFKHLVQHLLRTHVLRISALGRDTVPQLVVHCEAWLDVPTREQIVDIVLASATVAGVDTNTFAEELFDCGPEGGAIAG